MSEGPNILGYTPDLVWYLPVKRAALCILIRGEGLLDGIRFKLLEGWTMHILYTYNIMYVLAFQGICIRSPPIVKSWWHWCMQIGNCINYSLFITFSICSCNLVIKSIKSFFQGHLYRVSGMGFISAVPWNPFIKDTPNSYRTPLQWG